MKRHPQFDQLKDRTMELHKMVVNASPLADALDLDADTEGPGHPVNVI